MSTHIKILNKVDIKLFESAPQFNASERKKYFYSSDWINTTISDYDTGTNKVVFVLMFGYFQATKRFVPIKYFSKKDIEYVSNRLNIKRENINFSELDRRNVSRYRKVILGHIGYSAFDSESKKLVINECRQLVKKQIKPKSVFLLLIQFVLSKHIEIPRYHMLSEIITNAFNVFEKSLAEKIDSYLEPHHRELLDTLLEREDNDLPKTDEGRTLKRYKWTLLKRISQSTRASKIKENIKDLHTIQEIFESVQDVVKKMDLSPTIIQYYANWAKKARIFHIVSKSEWKRHLYFLTFIIHQYYVLQDVLVDTLLSSVQSAKNSSLREQKERYFEKRNALQNTISETASYIRNEISVNYTTIEEKLKDSHLSYQSRVDEALSLIETRKEMNKRIKHKLDELESEAESTMKQDEYAILESKSLQLQRKVSPIIKRLSFKKESSNTAIIEAVHYFQNHKGEIGKDAPIDFLEDEHKKAILGKKDKIRVSLYKIFLFFEVANAIKSGELNLVHSYKYKPFDTYLISKQYWIDHYDELIEKAGLKSFKDPEKALSKLETILNTQFEVTNQNILDDKNKFIKFNKKEEFFVDTPKVEKDVVDNVAELFPQDRYVQLLEVLSSIDQQTHFSDSFEHYNLKYNRDKPKGKIFYAGVMGYGCNIGIKRMSKISRGIGEHTLDNTVNWYFSLENLLSANNKILEFMDKLELANEFLKDKDSNHTASDGKKRGVARDSLFAQYSFKYFGSGQGVSIYTFIDERHLLFHSTVISSGLREASYVIDGLLHNDVVQSGIHSTDTHGYTEAIFGATHLLGFSFAPRIKKLADQQLYSFLNKLNYEKKGYKILPDSKIDVQLIKDNWDDILRFIATLKLNVTTADQLFKRLNSYSRQHPLYRALKELGKIVKTIFLLKYIDDVELRQSIEKQLNKVENSNKFSDAVFFANNQEFQVETQEEQEIIEHCKRLIENAIICWNYLYLSRVIANTKDISEKQRLIEAIKNGSIVFWKHINVFGEYDFTENAFKNFQDSSFPKNAELKAA
ncbi:MAG: Tn3 family transposase [Candidatus Margulisbacteria bacterium]|nr:Tn3 family transposase [Candidatus Margulisiibacteriota bacterium]